jgi:methylglutaconyl-CoA hydratase
MTEPNFLSHTDDRNVARVTLNRPEVHNAFDDVLIAGLTTEFARLSADESVRAIVLAGNGKSFSAGGDLNWMKRMASYDRDENLADARALAAMMRTLNESPKPVIGLVHGAAFGGGVGLVACCDMVVAARRAVFCLSEVRLGLLPAVISPYVVRAIGARASRRYFLTAERFDAEEAYRLGLVHVVCDDDGLEAAGDALLAEIMAGGPQGQGATKALIRRVQSGPIDDAMTEATAVAIADVRASDEGREGTAAFLEKRAPAWRGNG